MFDFDARVIENLTTVVEFELPRKACNGLEVDPSKNIYRVARFDVKEIFIFLIRLFN